MTTHADRIAEYYDRNTEPFYLTYWDPVDMHFGLFDSMDERPSVSRAAKRMTSRIVSPGAIAPSDVVVDAGCGVGGAAIDVSAQHGCRVTGLTISQVQVDLATRHAAEAGLADRVRFSRCDCSARLPFDDGTVDVVMTIEAACHFEDKRRFLAECERVLRPAGRLVGSDWMAANDASATDRDALLEPVCDAWRLAGLESPASWRQMLEDVGFEVRACEDLRDAVIENARVLERAQLELTLEVANGCHTAEDATLWGRQYETLVRAWTARAFTIGRFFARKPAGIGA